MEIAKALAFFAENRLGTLVTLREDGSPHVSVVGAGLVDGELWISATQDRVKTRNVRRDPRVAFLSGTGPWVAVEGTARILDGPDVGEQLRTYYRAAAGEHPDWNEYDEAMRSERRLVIAVTPTRAYGG